MDDRAQKVLSTIDQATGYQRLVLLVGLPGSGKTRMLRSTADERSFPVINVNLALAKRLMDFTREERPRVAAQQLTELIIAAGSSTIGLDNLELLFSPDLKLRPLPLLLDLSRHHRIVATWSGYVDVTTLSYARPGHPEFQQEPLPTCPILNLNVESPAETP